jgi:hypothetical protein
MFAHREKEWARVGRDAAAASVPDPRPLDEYTRCQLSRTAWTSLPPPPGAVLFAPHGTACEDDELRAARAILVQGDYGAALDDPAVFDGWCSE